MKSIPLLSLFLIAMAASAQRSTGFRGGAMGGFRSGGGGFGPSVSVGLRPGAGGRFFGPRIGRPRFGNGFGNFGYPYSAYSGLYPFIGDYGLLGDYDFPYLTPDEYPPINNPITVPPGAPDMSASPPPPPQTAHSVMKEYKWNETEAPSAVQPTTFTVALKDGSKRDAVAAWVQDRSLHFLDSEGRQQVLSGEVIDRETTQRLNRQKNLSLQLPPG